MTAARPLRTLLGAAVALAIAAPAVLAEKAPDADGDKWDPTEVMDLQASVPESEPNNTASQANPFSCGDVLTPAAISPAGDVDYIVFTANNGDIIQFGTDSDGGATPVPDTFIDLIASDGTTVLDSDDDDGPGLYSLIQYTATYTGTYYGRIRAFSTTHSGSYRAFVGCYPPVPPVCEIGKYKGDVVTLPSPLPIPDNTLGGVTVGPLPTPNDGTRFLDVVLGLRITHTWVGDLVATLSYDQDCDGTPEATARVICRPGRATCDGTLGSPFGCASNLSCNNITFISDAGAIPLGVPPTGCGLTATVLAGGCYLPNTTGETLAAFDGLLKGGCFRLNVADHGVGDTGTLCEWGVYTLNEDVVPVESTTWSRIKSRY